jgi:hypothetical protein
MPETLAPFDIEVMASDLEPADLYGTNRRLGESVNAALSRPYVDLRASAATSIAHNQAAFVKVALATTTYADVDYFGVSSSVVTILETGIYDLSAGSGFASGSAMGEFALCLNGLAFGTDIRRFKPGVATVSAEREATIAEPHYALTAGDTIQIGAYQFQTAGSAALNTIADSRLLIRKVG